MLRKVYFSVASFFHVLSTKCHHNDLCVQILKNLISKDIGKRFITFGSWLITIVTVAI